MHLCHDGMIGSVGELPFQYVCAFVDILHLKAALLVEPILQTSNDLVLIHAERGVEIEEVVGSHDVEALDYGNIACNIATTAGSTAVFAFQVFPMYVEMGRLIVKAYGPAIALVVVALLDVWVEG